MTRFRYVALMEAIPGKPLSSRPVLTSSDPATVARCVRVLTDRVTPPPAAGQAVALEERPEAA